MVSHDALESSRAGLKEVGIFSDQLIEEALKAFPNNPDRAFEYALECSAQTEDEPGARSVTGGPTFQQVDPSTAYQGKEVVRFADEPAHPAPPPSPRNELPPPYAPSTAITVKPEKQNNVIDVDEWAKRHKDDDDEDALQRAMAASLQDHDPGMEQALADSLRSAAIQQDEHEPLHAPAAKRRRAEHTPVILRPTSSESAWLAPAVQLLYACPPFRNAVLALPIEQAHHPEGSTGFEQFWNGRLVFLPTGDAKHDLVTALQRLFAFITHTTRHAVSLADLEHAYRPDSNLSDSGGLGQMQRFFEDLGNAWQHVSAIVREREMRDGLDVESADALLEKRHRTLLNAGAACDTETGKESVTPSLHSYMPVVQPFSLGGGSGQQALWQCLDRVFEDDGSQIALLTTPGQSVIITISRPQISPERRLFDFPPELYLDRYAQTKLSLIKEKRAKLRLAIEEQASLAKKRELLVDSKNQSSLDGSLSYLEKTAKADDEAASARHSALRQSLEKARDLVIRRLADFDGKLDALKRSAQGIFDGEDMQDVGPYQAVAMILSDGMNRFHTYVADHVEAKGYKVTATDAFECDPEALLTDETGLYTGGGLIGLAYARPLDEDAFKASDLNESILTAIDADNAAFEAEQAVDMDAEVPSMPIEVVQPDAPLAGMLSEAVGDASAPHEDVDMMTESQDAARLRGGAAASAANDSDDDEGEDMAETGGEGVQLGFLSDMPRKGLDVTSMTGKVGGRPLWLDPSKPLEASQLQCRVCRRPESMSFLLQLNAPDDDNADAYYRMLYIYACDSAACIAKDASGSIRVFRSQLREDAACLNDSPAQPIKHVNGVSKAYKEYELVSEPEEAAPAQSAPITVPLPRLDGAFGPDADEPDTRVAVDDAFLRFQSRLAAEPEQVIRYYFGDPLPEPLWISDKGKAVAASVPHCSICDHARTCELQILPTLISHLGVVDETQPDSFDFGTLLIYTCSKRCSIPDQGWAEEYCHAQAVSQEGLSLQAWRRPG